MTNATAPSTQCSRNWKVVFYLFACLLSLGLAGTASLLAGKHHPVAFLGRVPGTLTDLDKSREEVAKIIDTGDTLDFAELRKREVYVKPLPPEPDPNQTDVRPPNLEEFPNVDLKVTGVVVDRKRRLAIVNGRICSLNDTVEGVKILTIQDDSVTFADDYGNTRTIQVFKELKTDESPESN